MNESCRLQCRLAIETRTNAYQVRTREFGEDQISVYFTVRQYWGTGPEMTFLESFRRQRDDRRGDRPAAGHPPHRAAAGSGDRLEVKRPSVPVACVNIRIMTDSDLDGVPCPDSAQLARNLKAETAFTVLAIARALKAKGKDVVELEIGDSPFPSTPKAKAAGIQAIEENQTGYGPSLGLPEFRAAAAQFVTAEFGYRGRRPRTSSSPRAPSRSSSTSPRRCSTPAMESWSSAPNSRHISRTSNAAARGRCWSRCSAENEFRPPREDVRQFLATTQAAGDLPQLAAQPDRRRGDARRPGRDRRRGARART